MLHAVCTRAQVRGLKESWVTVRMDEDQHLVFFERLWSVIKSPPPCQSECYALGMVRHGCWRAEHKIFISIYNVSFTFEIVAKEVLWSVRGSTKNMRFPVPDILDDDYIHPPLIGHYTNFWPLLIWTFLPNLTFYLIMRGFHRIFATGAACQQMMLTPPDTWFCPTFGLACVIMSRLISPKLVLFPDFWVLNILRYFSFAYNNICFTVLENMTDICKYMYILLKRIEYTQTSNISWRKLYASVNKIILSIYTQIVSKATMQV